MKRRKTGIMMAFLAVLAVVAGVGGAVMMAEPVQADRVNVPDSICDDTAIDAEIREAAGCKIGDDKQKTLPEVIVTVIDFVLAAAGIIAVCVMIYGGFLYITSAGDSAKVNKGKATIVYGVIGLIIALLAFAIVSFVSSGIPQGKTGGTGGAGSSDSDNSP